MASSRSSFASSSLSSSSSRVSGVHAPTPVRRNTAPPVVKTSDVAPPTRVLQNARFKLFVRVHSGQNLQGTTQGSYVKGYVGDTVMVSGSQSALFNLNALTESAGNNANAQPSHREFRTHVEYPVQRAHPVWNEKFEVGVLDPEKEILSFRVKSQQMVYCPTIGACAIYLKQLKIGETVDQWFPLYKGHGAAGHIRVQLLLSVNPLASQVAHPPVARAATNPASLQNHHEQELLRQKRAAEEGAALRREGEALRKQREAEKEKERLREEEERRRRRKAEKEMERQRIQEEERRRRRKAEKELKRRAEAESELAEQQKQQDKERSASENSDEEKPRAKSASGKSNQEETKLKDQVVDLASAVADVSLAEKFSNGHDSDGSETIEYVSDDDISLSPSSSRSPARHQSARSWRKSSSRVSSHSSSKQRLSSTKSARDEFDRVENNALPSDSSDSSSSTSSEEERRRRKKRKEKKKRRKAKKAEKKARRKAKKAAKKLKKGKAADSDSDSDSDSSSSSSSPSSSSSDTSSDERRKRRAKKKKATRSSRKSPASSKNQWTDSIDPGMVFDVASAAFSALTGNNQESGGVDGTTYNPYTEAAQGYGDFQGADGGDMMQGDSGFEVGDWLDAASSAASLALDSTDDQSGEIATALIGAATLIPIGKYLGKKIHSATSNAIHRYQEQQREQQAQLCCQVYEAQEVQDYQEAEAVQEFQDYQQEQAYQDQQQESIYYF